jgi:DivIVA domain-containing protein
VAKRGTIDRVMWVWVLVIVALTGGVVAVAVGRGGSMSEVYDDRPDATLPSGRPLTSDDVRDVRFSTAVRGYRMDEVDALLARVRADLMARESASPDEEVHVVGRPEPPAAAASAQPPAAAASAQPPAAAASAQPPAAAASAESSATAALPEPAIDLHPANDTTAARPGQHVGRRATDDRDAAVSEREQT